MLAQSFTDDNKNVEINGDEMIAKYKYHILHVVADEKGVKVANEVKNFEFKTEIKAPKAGIILNVWSSNNVTTLTSGILANKRHIKFDTKRDKQEANYYCSLTQCATTCFGQDENDTKYVAPFKSLFPVVDQNDLIIGAMKQSAHVSMNHNTLTNKG